MKKKGGFFSAVLAMAFFSLFLFACGSSGSSHVATANPPSEDAKDCIVESFTMTGDFGYVASFELILRHPDPASISGPIGVHGQSAPNREWVLYEELEHLDSETVKLHLDWPKGEAFHFSLFTRSGEDINYVEPTCSGFVFPEGAALNEQHLHVVLGEREICPAATLADPLVKAIEDLEQDQWRVYFDYTQLPIQNYSRLVLWGQIGPDNIWSDVHYVVHDQYPCYSADIIWPKGSLPFEFTMCVDKEGVRECVDPTISEFKFGDSLGIEFK